MTQTERLVFQESCRPGSGLALVLNILLAIFAAIAPLARPFYTYALRPTHVSAGAYGLPSCGGARRFLNEKWKVRVWSYDRVTVNGMTWRIDDEAWGDGPPLGDMRLVFRVNEAAYTYLVMDLYTNRDGAIGKLALIGRTPDRAECTDVIDLEGECE